MSAHTPGPWKAHFEEAYFVTGPDLGRVAMMMHLKGPHGMGGRRSGDESAANARLIAAAPRMFDALQRYLSWSDPVLCRDTELNAIREEMRAAVSEATGSAS